MKVLYSKKFLKQLSKLPYNVKEKIEFFVFDDLPTLDNIELSGKIEKMRGYSGYYKVRFGDYRVGLYKQAENIIVKLVMHRKDIYNYFP